MAGINWPGLFAWSTKYHDGTAPSQFKQMTDEDRKFLEKAMEEAFGKIEDPNKIFQGAIEQIKSADRTDESITTALEIIDRCCDDPDVARNVEKLDGMQPLLDLAVSPSHQGAIHLRTLEILVLLWSNNPAIQEVGMKRGGMRKLLGLIQNAPQGSEERAKAFAALVALMRQVETFEVEFLSNQTGVALLVDSMSPEEAPRMREKALSFVRSVTGDGRLDAADAKPLSSAVACLLRDAKADFAGQSIQYRETLAGCLLELALQFPEGVVPELVEAANARMEQLHGANNSDDEVEMGLFKEGLAASAVRGGSIATASPAA
jgi:hypothetical protein